MPRFSIKIILLLLVCLAATRLVDAQKVGLVLSGGGSKGLAHIGVIRALEENNIPIDYVTGTSIGAIIGGLYAIGYSPDEMEAIIQSEDFINWYKGNVPDNYQIYFKKKDDHAEMLNLKFAVRDSSLVPVLPTNLVANQPMDLGIIEIYSRNSAGAGHDFDKLFVPYRCVATDIHRNKAVVFSKGDMGYAVRASMTFPFYFKPISIDSTLLFDGGIVNNFPYDVMQRDFKPDVIIGSLVSSDTQMPDEDDILGQIENMIINEQLSLSMPDSLGITIKSDFSKTGLLEFSRLEEFSTIGYINTMNNMEMIKKKISRRIPLDEVNKRREIYKKQQPEFLIDNIIIYGVDKYEQKYILNSLKQNKKLLTLEQFKKAYYTLVLDNQIESAQPKAVYNSETGYFDMYLNVKKTKRYDLLIGANLSSGFANMAFIGANYKILGKYAYFLHANIYFGRLYSSLYLSARMDIPSETPLALKFSGSLNRWDYYKSSSRTFFEDIRPPYLIHHDYYLRGELETPMTNSSKLSAGINTGLLTDNYFQINNFLQSDTADVTDLSYLRIFGYFEHNTLNYKIYPNKGTYRNIGVSYYLGKEVNYPGSTSSASDTAFNTHYWLHVRAVNDSYLNLSKRFTLGLYGEFSACNIPLMNNYTSTVITAQGFYPTPHSRTIYLEEYRANVYFATGIKGIYKFTKRLDLRLEGFLFVPYQKIIKQDIGNQIFKAYYSKPFYTDPISFLQPVVAATVVFTTPIGPASISAHYYQKEGGRFYYLFHIGYILFNKKTEDY